MKYEINADKSFELRIWLEDETKQPTIIQPHWPDGTAWANYEEAEGWAEATLAQFTDPAIKFIAGSSPAEPLQELPAPPTTIEKLSELGISAEELKAALDSLAQTSI
tara:strand:- start:176 stop:496 length:321 start_codon:yes stop_codon:yes gene_type:complete